MQLLLQLTKLGGPGRFCIPVFRRIAVSIPLHSQKTRLAMGIASATT